MEQLTQSDVARLRERAGRAAAMLSLLANERRLLVLCALAVHGERSVNALAEDVGLGQSALSQHLAKMRAEGLVAVRRERQSAYYRIADRDAARILLTLKDIYC